MNSFGLASMIAGGNRIKQPSRFNSRNDIELLKQKKTIAEIDKKEIAEIKAPNLDEVKPLKGEKSLENGVAEGTGKDLLSSNGKYKDSKLETDYEKYLARKSKEGREIGYITLGAIEDGYDAYDIFIKDNVISSILGKLKGKSSRANASTDSNQAKLIFLPPMKYIIQSTDESDQVQYFH
jgi:hypothetical protein